MFTEKNECNNPAVDHQHSLKCTIDTYARQSQIALGQLLSNRYAIYLDTKYWILLRKAAAGTGSAEAKELLVLLRNGVFTGRLFCPISESVFIELMEQRDQASRLTTAALIDELSLGATLITQETRIATEIAHFLHAKTGRSNIYPLKQLVWCKLSYVLGIMHPTNTAFEAVTELEIQKILFEHMWTISLYEMISIMGDNEFPGTDQNNVAAHLNADIAAHADELRTFKQAYVAEVRGIVDLVGGTAVDILMSMAKHEGVILEQPTAEQRRTSENQFKSLLAVALEKDKAREELCTIHILASLHASLRWNKGRKIKSNDLFDFDHAAAALAYGDAFFTEKPLCDMVTQGHLALNRLYKCHVTANVNNAIEFVAGLSC